MRSGTLFPFDVKTNSLRVRKMVHSEHISLELVGNPDGSLLSTDSSLINTLFLKEFFEGKYQHN